jgi:orotidine-5'-phosphate decarboxylase
MSTFADRIYQSIQQTRSCLVAGCDPVIERLPSFILAEAEQSARSDAEWIERVLRRFCDLFVSSVEGKVAAIKPNVAFFEQYGLPGLTVFSDLCGMIRSKNIPLIIDAKRGDIGTTATAYSNAFLGNVSVRGRSFSGFEGDALTINPFLGFDTLEPFLKDCVERGKGIFVLARTSNPGAKDLQGLSCDGRTVSERVADWIHERSAALKGACGWSGLGAVVGASYPDEARALRARMPSSLFLIPGFGAQGADAKDSVAGFGVMNGLVGGALVNVSRGLLEGMSNSDDQLQGVISKNVNTFNSLLNAAMSAK